MDNNGLRIANPYRVVGDGGPGPSAGEEDRRLPIGTGDRLGSGGGGGCRMDVDEPTFIRLVGVQCQATGQPRTGTGASGSGQSLARGDVGEVTCPRTGLWLGFEFQRNDRR